MVKRAKTDRDAHFQTALTEDSAEGVVPLWLRPECNCIEPVYDRQLEEDLLRVRRDLGFPGKEGESRRDFVMDILRDATCAS